jgi:hypothetical protein
MQQYHSRQNRAGLADLHPPNVYTTPCRDVSVALPTSARRINQIRNSSPTAVGTMNISNPQ